VEESGDHRDLHLSIRRQRQMCIRDRTYTYGQPIKLSSLAEGEHTLTYFSVDKVNNNEEKKTHTFFLDKSAPRVISEVVGNTFIANGREYFSGRTKLKLVALDNKAGVRRFCIP